MGFIVFIALALFILNSLLNSASKSAAEIITAIIDQAENR